MKIAKSLLLGSAAGIAAISGVQAADLPVAKAAPVEYVRVCAAYGAGFFYVPGTDTCIKIGGRVRAEYTYVQPKGATVLTETKAPFANLTTGRVEDRVTGVTVRKNGRDRNVTGFRARARLETDVRTPTDYGTLRAFLRFQIDHDAGSASSTSGTKAALDRAFIQWAGITAGRTQSFFDFYASDLNWSAGFLGAAGSDTVTDLLAYTATFGSGFSATLSVEDRDTRHVNSSSYQVAGQRTPDVVGVLRIDQDWGSAQLSGALHQLNTIALTGPFSQRVDTKYGWAVQGGVNLKLPALSAGDKLWLQAAYADGALHYLGLTSSLSSADFSATAYDAVIANGSLKTTKGWNVTGGLLHYWTPAVRQGVWGTYTAVNYSHEAKLANINNTNVRNFDAWTVGSNLIWSPVKAFDIGVEVLYTKAEKRHFAPALDFFRKGQKSEDSVQGRLRLQRDF